MTAETITREEIERLYAVFARVEDLEPSEIGPLLAHAYAEPARLAAARAEGVREGLAMAAKLIDEQYPLTNHVVGGRVSISGAIRAIASAPAEAPTTPTAKASDGWIEWDGGRQPVPDSTVVHVRYRDGTENASDLEAADFAWDRTWPADPSSIIAYRIVQPTEASAPVAVLTIAPEIVSDMDAEIFQLRRQVTAMEERIAALEAENEKLRERNAEADRALEPFAEIGAWLFARDLPDDAPLVNLHGLNGMAGALTRGHFKAAHTVRALLHGQGGADASGGDDGR